MAAQIAGTCKDKEGATDADLATFLARDAPATQSGKCLVACFLETIGIVSVSNFKEIYLLFCVRLRIWEAFIAIPG